MTWKTQGRAGPMSWLALLWFGRFSAWIATLLARSAMTCIAVQWVPIVMDLWTARALMVVRMLCRLVMADGKALFCMDLFQLLAPGSPSPGGCRVR